MIQYWAPSSPGDLADRWTILQLKLRKAADDDNKKAAVVRRMQELQIPAFDEPTMALVDALARINDALWDLEDTVRALIASEDQGPATSARFVRAARSIPLLNDLRNHIKARIDAMMGYADIQDPKLYGTPPADTKLFS
jgi:hypothetical protein